ncbi:hypothetical protein SAMD00019534_006530 [Acytostelium subglobosum LB1]|uniref:hypothetical protein n=1 Tax=Acytostelium subglobosum LB1 TaxID=1410327 RepID=UPI0006451E3D|nr:hypothetical protein SAMD00019534_006530 [Acytostelium subglobosum LB1]GAM17478.1 hypothetical protein SAMD00019534_006530 [Acytostelium subglobosum LB1]|eukprot:XP_012759540.1 hypothetical protein SAMD00019534_006530 [Acytostelium subglobosum LB1]
MYYVYVYVYVLINQTTFPDVVFITSILEYSGDDFLLLGLNISATWVCNVMLYHFNSKSMILSTKSKGPSCLKGYASDSTASLGYDAMNNIAFQVGAAYPPPEWPVLMQYNFDTNKTAPARSCRLTHSTSAGTSTATSSSCS